MNMTNSCYILSDANSFLITGGGVSNYYSTIYILTRLLLVQRGPLLRCAGSAFINPKIKFLNNEKINLYTCPRGPSNGPPRLLHKNQ